MKECNRLLDCVRLVLHDRRSASCSPSKARAPRHMPLDILFVCKPVATVGLPIAKRLVAVVVLVRIENSFASRNSRDVDHYDGYRRERCR